MNLKRYFKTASVLFILSLSINLSAKQIVVDNTSIQQAIDTALPHDTVWVMKGLYIEELTINIPLTFSGIGGPTLSGDSAFQVLTIDADSVHISGFEIIDIPTSYINDLAAIRIKDSKDFTITNNILRNTFFGIYVAHSKRGTIAHNICLGEAKQENSSGNAIHIWYCDSMYVQGNTVQRHRDGIYFEFVKNSIIGCNTSRNNLRYGLHFMFSDHDEYYGNIFKNNGAGVAVMFSRHISMCRNEFSFNWGAASYGLLLKEIYDAELKDNLFSNNTKGIHAEGAVRIAFENNIFKGNGWAMHISGSCDQNTIVNNDFLSNTFDLAVNSSFSDNKFEHNYWSDYTGYDLDHDGEGDVPYYPVKVFNYIIHKSPEAIVLLRSMFIDFLNFSEKVSPVFIPKDVVDRHPSMKVINVNS
jgi:nitrous oxidase accessory protein